MSSMSVPSSAPRSAAAPPSGSPSASTGASADGWRRRRRQVHRAGWLALVLSTLLVLPAAAHPFIAGGGEVPVDSLATVSLNVAHGCASETAGEGDPTTEVALEVPEWMWVADVPEPDGWEVSFQTDPEGFATVVIWDALDAVEPAPVFDLDVVVEGDPGEERFLSVFQACDDFQYRWIGTPDEPADDPAIRVRLVDADPDAPAPERTPIVTPEEEVVEEEPMGEAPADDDATTTDAPAEDAADDGEVDAPEVEEAPVDEVAEDETVETDTLAAEGSDDEGGLGVLLLAVAIAVAIAVVVVVIRRRGAGSEAA